MPRATLLSGTLAVGSLLGLVIAVLYAGIASRLVARAGPSPRLAPGLFALFWGALGVHAAFESLWALALSAWPLPLAVGVTVHLVKVLTGVLAFFGLVSYLLLVYSGRRRAVAWSGAFYALLFLFVTWYYVQRVPVAQETRAWFAGLRFEHAPGPLWPVVVALLFVPPLLATLAYALLLRVARGRAQRARIATVSASLAVFFGGFLLGWLHEQWAWWGLVERVLALAAASGVLLTLRDGPADAGRA